MRGNPVNQVGRRRIVAMPSNRQTQHTELQKIRVIVYGTRGAQCGHKDSELYDYDVCEERKK